MQTKHKYLNIVFIALSALFLFSACGKKTIINGVEEKEANEILVILASKDIDASKEAAASGSTGGASKAPEYDIQVSESDSIQAMAILNQFGLPRQKSTTLLDIFAGSGLVPSETEEKIRYHAGLEAQLSSVIRKIDGVIDANVQLSIPEKDPMDTSKVQPPTHASVFVKHQGILDDPNSHLSTKIKRLVANSVPNLDYEDVTVVPFRARYAEISIDSPHSGSQKEYVKVWMLVIAKESVTAFRVIFVILILLIVLFAATTGWMIWKHMPIIKKKGWKSLFTIKENTKNKNSSSIDPKENKQNAASKPMGDDDSYDFDEDEEHLLEGGPPSSDEDDEEL